MDDQQLLKIKREKIRYYIYDFTILEQFPKTPVLQNGESSITPRNLGVMFDKFINLNDHVTSVCRAAYYHLKNILSLKPFLSEDALTTVVHAFVTPLIDYCNSLLYGIVDYNINRLQRIQNGAVRMVTNNGKYRHVKISMWSSLDQKTRPASQVIQSDITAGASVWAQVL